MSLALCLVSYPYAMGFTDARRDCRCTYICNKNGTNKNARQYIQTYTFPKSNNSVIQQLDMKQVSIKYTTQTQDYDYKN